MLREDPLPEYKDVASVLWKILEVGQWNRRQLCRLLSIQPPNLYAIMSRQRACTIDQLVKWCSYLHQQGELMVSLIVSSDGSIHSNIQRCAPGQKLKAAIERPPVMARSRLIREPNPFAA